MLRNLSALVVGVLLAACGSLPERPNQRVAEPLPPSTETIQAAQLVSYASALQTMVQGSPTEQAELLFNARAAYEQAKLGSAALRYGLLLAAPGHPARDAGQAQRLLREALARPELLTVVERALAVVELQRVDTELRLFAENERLIAEAQRERDRQRVAPTNNTALNRRLQAEIDENARLRKALDDARAKLDAIANIERSVSERLPAPEPRAP